MTAPTNAIETHYAGCRFRSRLEARWAVFLDTARIPWLYEPEGFELPSGRYLPDFLLPECGTWIEVKGVINDAAILKHSIIAKEIPKPAPQGGEAGATLMLVGPIPDPPIEGDIGWHSFAGQGDEQDSYAGFGSYSKNHRPWWLEQAYDEHETGIAHAYLAARKARFEYGETPAR